MAEQRKPDVVCIRAGVEIDAKQKIPYFVGISEATAGARGISLQRVVIPPGGAAVPHIHQGYETAIYVLSGHVETTYGPGLRKSVVSGPGEFVYIAPDVPHQARNMSATEPAVGIVARNDANEQERVIVYDPEADVKSETGG
ncbi:MAG: cupin domain-containing protein [Deltaproteobacteria bacterium]|nr:cupin domain-containing protein [Deltaproteobacteria bacterium]